MCAFALHEEEERAQVRVHRYETVGRRGVGINAAAADFSSGSLRDGWYWTCG
jgi:hypothetical protein